MKIVFHPPEFLIGVVRKVEWQEKVESDFLLRAVQIRNTTGKPVHIIEYCFDLRSKGRSQKKIFYPEEMVRKRSLALLELKEKLMIESHDVKETIRKGNLLFLMGTEKFWDREQLSTNTLEPNQETGFFYEHFRILASEPIDELVFTAVFIRGNKKKNISINIPVIQYETRNKFIFPLRGVWMVLGNWDDPHSHRTHYSQEFGLDLVQLDNDMQFVQSKEKPNEEYPCYGENVIAIADGEVVSCLGGSPENPKATVFLPREQRIRVFEEQGFLSLANGNFVVLKHWSDEFSFYGHLRPGLRVKKGDRVKQGQVLGRIGNSGHSSGPHLHFQLMNGPDIMTARGLPCYFSNVRNFFGESVEFIEYDRLIVHAE